MVSWHMVVSETIDLVWGWGRKGKSSGFLLSKAGPGDMGSTWTAMEETYFWDWSHLHIILAADIPPSPGNIPTTHPLMVRHADHSSLTLGSGSSTTRLTQGIGRSQRTLRQLTANTGHTIHVHYPGNRQPNPPLILQRWVRSRICWTPWSS